MAVDVTELSDEALAADAAHEGSDGPAFVALVDRFRQRVWRICFRLLNNEQPDVRPRPRVLQTLGRIRLARKQHYSPWPSICVAFSTPIF